MTLRSWIPIDKIEWIYLCCNPNAISFLEQYPEKIDWWNVSANPNAIQFLEQHLCKINYEYLSSNPNGIHLLKQYQYENNPNRIDWYKLLFIN